MQSNTFGIDYAGQAGPSTAKLAWTAARSRPALVALLFALATVAWWSTGVRMQGMDEGPWTALGAFGWFTGVWLVMMAAMMVPSVAPTVVLYSRMTTKRSPLAPLLFTASYLVVWGVFGLLAFALAVAGAEVLDGVLAWEDSGREIAGLTLLVAAAYELTPAKHVCLGRCRRSLGFLLGSWRDGSAGAVRMGAEHGAWCVGCCWALMASLFALGLMSIVWMVFSAVVIALEKLLPWRSAAAYGSAAILLVLGVLLLVAPDAIPALTIPGDHAMPPMDPTM